MADSICEYCTSNVTEYDTGRSYCALGKSSFNNTKQCYAYVYNGKSLSKDLYDKYVLEESISKAEGLIEKDKAVSSYAEVAKLWSAYLDVKISEKAVEAMMSLYNIGKDKATSSKHPYKTASDYMTVAGRTVEIFNQATKSVEAQQCR